MSTALNSRSKNILDDASKLFDIHAIVAPLEREPRTPPAIGAKAPPRHPGMARPISVSPQRVPSVVFKLFFWRAGSL
jgi:hypothetical protein